MENMSYELTVQGIVFDAKVRKVENNMTNRPINVKLAH